MEMYEKQKPFRLADFAAMSNFLNIFLYKAVLGNLFGKWSMLPVLLIFLFSSGKNYALKCFFFDINTTIFYEIPTAFEKLQKKFRNFFDLLIFSSSLK